MTQDSDDILAQVFSISTPTTGAVIEKTESHETYEINGNTIKEEHHVEVVRTDESHVHHESHVHVVNSERDLLETVRRASNAFEDFVHATGVVDIEQHMESNRELLQHEEEHAHDIGLGATIETNHHDFPEEKESAVSVPRSTVSSVSVHSSVSQKSAQYYDEPPAVAVVNTVVEDHHSHASEKSDSTVKNEHNEVIHSQEEHDHHHHHDEHADGSVISGTTQNTGFDKYSVAEHHEEIVEKSVHATPVVPAKSAPHDAVIEEFKLLHHREPSEVSEPPSYKPPPPPSSPPPSDHDTDVVLTMKVTKYEFDSGDVHSTEVVEEKHHHEHHAVEIAQHDDQFEILHHRELESEPAFYASEVEHEHHHHHGHQSDSDNDLKFETVDYTFENHEAPEPEPVYNAYQSSAPVFHSKIVPPEPIRDRSESEGSTLVDDTSRTIHREIVPKPSGPHVRDDLRPVTLTNEVHETHTHHHHSTVASPPAAPKSAPVAKVAQSQEIFVVSAPVAAKEHVVDLHEHHHHHREQHELSNHIEEDEIFSGPSVKDLRSLFETGKANVHRTEHVIHHHHYEGEVVEPVILKVHDRSNSVHVEPVVHHEIHHHNVETGVARLPLREQRVSGQTSAVPPAKPERHHHHHHHARRDVQKQEVSKQHNEHHHHHHHRHKSETRVERREHIRSEKHEVHHHEHHHHEHHSHEKSQENVDNHYEEVVEHHEHQHVSNVEEEDQLPVSELVSRFGQPAHLRRVDHHEEIRRPPSALSHTSSTPEIKDRTITESSTTTVTKSVASNKPTYVPIPAARVVHHPSNDYHSVRVVKSVRAFVSEWGSKDFRPPSSPIITVPRSPRSPAKEVFAIPETRKSTVREDDQSTLHDYVVVENNIHHVEEQQRSVHPHLPHRSQLQQNGHVVSGVSTRRNSAQSQKSVKSVRSVAPNYNQTQITTTVVEARHEECPECLREEIESRKHSVVHSEESEEDFRLIPISERRALFERGATQSTSVRRLPQTAPPMIDVLHN